MGKVLLSILFLVIGAVIGFFGGGLVGGGAGIGLGIAQGASAGICMTVRAAEEDGLLTPEEIDQVLTRAAADIAEIAGNDAPAEVVGGADDCAQVIERLRSAQ